MEVCLCADTALFFLSASMVVIHVLLRLSFHARSAGWVGVFMYYYEPVTRVWLRVMQTFMSLVRRTSSTSATMRDQLVKRKLVQRRLEASHAARVNVAHCLCFKCFVFVARSLVGLPILLSTSQFSCELVAMCVSMLAYSTFTRSLRVMELWYAAMMTLISVYGFFGAADNFLASVIGTLPIRLLISSLHLNVESVIFWNLLNLLARFLHALQDQSFAQYWPYEVVSTVFVVVAAASVKQWMILQVRQEVDIAKLQIDNSASASLLDLVCDVVLELSDRFRIVRDSRTLAAFLMRMSGSSLEGMMFTEFISDELAKHDFEERMRSSTSSEGKVGTFSTTLSDNLGNHIGAEIFFVKIQMDVDCCHYMLGIRESREAASIRTIPEPNRDTQACKKRKPLQFIGTPSNSDRSALEGRSAPPPSLMRRRLSYPHLVPTTNLARSMSLSFCMSTWNISIKGTDCCEFHAYVNASKKVLNELRRKRCQSDFPPSQTLKGMQCQKCGIIQAEDEECHTCGSPDLTFLEELQQNLEQQEQRDSPNCRVEL
eukprot:TRINITY_DN10709_c0_g1_i4.p1 TRINITY_DN10709_c0_g1~~TRINITY_DN10709_c0_g1_i4.p1  ORF type:complete len:543 (-),score=62.33 TRINITY_DN10709_c0_g1_i4:354-1982(-)